MTRDHFRVFRTRSSWPADLVVIHKLGKGPAAPSLSPYPIKLETYLRMAKIHYVVRIIVWIYCVLWDTYNVIIIIITYEYNKW